MKRFCYLLGVLTLFSASNIYTQEMPKEIPGLDVNTLKPKVMILGAFHFANPNRDFVKTERDSILSDGRQKEVRELIDRLKAFKPTKIAVEIPYGNTTVNDQYHQYLQNQFELKENEVYQAAFRLGKELNHKMLYPIDWQKDMNFEALIKSATASGQQKLLERFQQAISFIGPFTSQSNQYSVVEQLRWANDIEAQERLHKLYILMAEAGKGTDYTGADVVAGWYERNLKIAMNVIRTADSSDDRILVIIGAGHLKLLRQFLKESPDVEVVDAYGYLK